MLFFKFDMETPARKSENKQKEMLQKTEQCLYNGNRWLLVIEVPPAGMPLKNYWNEWKDFVYQKERENITI